MPDIISIDIVVTQGYLYFLQNCKVKLLLIKDIFINNTISCF